MPVQNASSLVDEVLDQAAVAQQVVGLDGGRVAGDVDRVGAEAAEQADRTPARGAEHEEAVVARHAVDLDGLDLDVGDEAAGAVEAVGGDDELVVALGAEQHDAVEAVAAVDRHRRVDDVLDEVAALAGVDRRSARRR